MTARRRHSCGTARAGWEPCPPAPWCWPWWPAGSQAAPTSAGRSTGTGGSTGALRVTGTDRVAAGVPSGGRAVAHGLHPAAIPAAVLDAVTGGSSARIDVVTSPGSVLAHQAASQAAALRTALSQLPHGSKVMGLSLARVQGFRFGSDMTQSRALAWLVSMDPYGGAYGAGGQGLRPDQLRHRVHRPGHRQVADGHDGTAAGPAAAAATGVDTQPGPAQSELRPGRPRVCAWAPRPPTELAAGRDNSICVEAFPS